MLDKTEKGYTKGTITNAEIIFSYDPLLREGIRYNELTQRIDVVRDMGWERGANGPSFTDNDLFNIHLYCDRVYGFTPKTIIEESLHITAHCNAYHPIRDFLSSLE